MWVKRLEKLVIAQKNITAQDKQYFSLWINKINICRTTLIRILARDGELHKLINEEPTDWKKVEAKINEAVGDNQHPGIRALVVLLQNLEQFEEGLEKGYFRKITAEEYQKRLMQLGKWGFRVKKEPQLANFLVTHWQGTTEMVKDAAGVTSRYFLRYLFRYGLPAVRDIINEKTWPGMVEMVKTAGVNAVDLFEYGLPAVKDIIDERTWPIIVKYVLAVEKYVEYVKRHLGFVPQGMFVPSKDLVNSKATYDIGELLEQQVYLAKQYFNEVGFTNYTKKVISENFWNFRYDSRIFNRLKFKKTGSGLVPLGGRFKTKILIRVITQESFEAWKTAQDAGIPVEEIARAYPAKNGKVRVYCNYAGERLSVFVEKHPEFSKEVEKQQKMIINLLNKRGIVHGHPHDGNFTVAEENGKLVVRAIDFDMATMAQQKKTFRLF